MLATVRLGTVNRQFCCKTGSTTRSRITACAVDAPGLASVHLVKAPLEPAFGLPEEIFTMRAYDQGAPLGQRFWIRQNNFESLFHSHDAGETTYIVKGQARLENLTTGMSYLVTEGDCIYIPAGHKHRFNCAGMGEVHFIHHMDAPCSSEAYETPAQLELTPSK